MALLRSPSLFFQGFNLYKNTHRIRNARQAEIHAEVAALERGLEVSTAGLRFRTGVVVAIETQGIQRYWLRFTQQGQHTSNGLDLALFKNKFVAHERGRWMHRCIQKIGIEQMVVVGLNAGVY